MKKRYQLLLLGFFFRLAPAILFLCLIPGLASAQVEQGGGSFKVQCPPATIRHPGSTNRGTGATGTPVNPHPDSQDADYTGPVPTSATQSPDGHTFPALHFLDSGGAIRCQQISGGDGLVTEADGNQTFMFSFGPLSGLNAIESGQPGTQFPVIFNQPYCDPAANGGTGNYNDGQPNPYCAAGVGNPNGAVGYVPRPSVSGVVSTSGATVTYVSGDLFPTWFAAGVSITINSVTFTISAVNADGTLTVTPSAGTLSNAAYSSVLPAYVSISTDPAAIMNTGVMNGNLPGPLMAFNEDDEFLLSLTNVGMIMRPDLFEQHTVHFHGYPNASSFYDGVPDATWAINIGGTATYYYLAPDAGTYFWHCHITPPEHIQMGMEGWLYVRPRQNRVPNGTNLYYALAGSAAPGSAGFATGTGNTATGTGQQSDLRTACYPRIPTTPTTPGPDILCSAPVPAANNGFTQGLYAQNEPLGRTGEQGYATGSKYKYVYNDGDGSTRYDIDFPINMHGFDPNFHFVGMTFNPEGFADMKDKYLLLNGRSYPDTIGVPAGSIPNSTWTGGFSSTSTCSGGEANPEAGSTWLSGGATAIRTEQTDTLCRPSQPYPAVIVLSASGGPSLCGTTAGTTGTSPCGERAALRINNLSVTEYLTLSSIGIPMTEVGFQAKILRDQAGNNLFIKSNSITIGGGEACDVIIDSTGVAPGTYFLYTPQLDHLSNDAENFGGLMTEIVVVP